MGFEPVQVRAAGALCTPLEAGQVSIGTGGYGLFRLEDLSLVDVADQAALLADCGNLRVALRRPRLPEDAGCIARVVPVKRARKPVRGRMTVFLAPAIRKLGLTLRAVGGMRYELTTHQDLLIINLGGARPAAGKSKK